MPIPRPSQSADSSQSVSASAYPSRRRLLAWTTLGAASLASAALAGCSDSAHAHASAAPSGSPAEGPSDSFSPAAPVDPNAASGLPSPATTSPAAVRTKPVFKVHDILPNAPADAIALTIDDGPWPVYTAQVLALLRKYDIRATFNVIGTQAHTYKDLIRQLAADGHTVANHTMTHPQRSRSAPPRRSRRRSPTRSRSSWTPAPPPPPSSAHPAATGPRPSSRPPPSTA